MAARSLNHFDPEILTVEDRGTAVAILDDPARLWRPDLVIAAGGEAPYLFRWYMVPRRSVGANVYFHIQVASDPLRPLHDHPWDNQSVILAGGYYELTEETTRWPAQASPVLRHRRPGDTVQRAAEDAHRLILPPSVPYCMTLFTTGPVRRDWGFHAPGGWISGTAATETRDGVSVWKEEEHELPV